MNHLQKISYKLGEYNFCIEYEEIDYYSNLLIYLEQDNITYSIGNDSYYSILGNIKYSIEQINKPENTVSQELFLKGLSKDYIRYSWSLDGEKDYLNSDILCCGNSGMFNKPHLLFLYKHGDHFYLEISNMHKDIIETDEEFQKWLEDKHEVVLRQKMNKEELDSFYQFISAESNKWKSSMF